MTIVYQGHKLSINEKVLTLQNAWENVKKIIEARIAINTLLIMEKETFEKNELTREKAKEILDKLTELEYNLQDAWRFNKDKNYHSYWLKLSSCMCPKMDNRELIGIDRRIVNTSCLYHYLEE